RRRQRARDRAVPQARLRPPPHRHLLAPGLLPLSSPPVSWLDAVIVVLVAVAAWQGWRRGLMIEVLSYGGLVFGLAAGAILAPAAAGLFSGVPTKALVSVIAIFGTGVLFQTAGFLIGASIRSHIRRRRVGHSFDAAGGAAISCILLLVGVWFVAVTMANGPSPALARAIKQSATVRAIDRVAPRPPNVLASVKKFLETSPFLEVRAGISPRLAPPVVLPGPSRLQR